MAHVKDDGMFDAPISKIWKFLQDDTPGVHNHQVIRSSRTISQSGPSMTQEMEYVNPDGKTTRKETWKFTFNPPHGFEMESLAGTTRGSKYAHRYTPVGNQTRVEVEGEFRIQGMDENATRQAALGMLATLFAEDQANLRKYR